jgi:hypothetical protein
MHSSRKIIISSAAITKGGLGTYLSTLAQSLKDQGWLVDVIVTDSKQDFYGDYFNTIECHDLTNIPLSMKKIKKAANLINNIAPDILRL